MGVLQTLRALSFDGTERTLRLSSDVYALRHVERIASEQGVPLTLDHGAIVLSLKSSNASADVDLLLEAALRETVESIQKHIEA